MNIDKKNKVDETNFSSPFRGLGGKLWLKGFLLLLAGLFLGWLFFHSPKAVKDEHDHSAEEAKKEIWTCSMHPQIKLDHPGKCPICGMTLIPVMSKPALPEMPSPTAQTVSAALPTLYTCPMANDADVVSDKPGNCPNCGMKLVPTSTVKHGKIAEEIWIKEHPH